MVTSCCAVATHHWPDEGIETSLVLLTSHKLPVLTHGYRNLAARSDPSLRQTILPVLKAHPRLPPNLQMAFDRVHRLQNISLLIH